MQSTHIKRLEQKMDKIYHENMNLRWQVQRIGQCNEELLKDMAELMNIAFYKEKIQSLEETNRDLLENFNEKTAELDESMKINKKLLAKIVASQEMETVCSSNVNHTPLKASGGSVGEVNCTPLHQPASANAAMGMYPTWNGMASGMVMVPMVYPMMMYPLSNSAPSGAPMANSKNPRDP